jgi:molybdopterin converting factor small subunit
MTRENGWHFIDLHPTPESAWDSMRSFLSIGRDDIEAMVATVEPLFRNGPDLIAGTYDYLQHNEETAAILGWEGEADPQHLAERRRFFTIWLARLLGFDLSHDFARYLFRAGQKHAGHGPRKVHVPERYVTGSISLINSAFARILHEEMGGDPVVAPALAGWNKLLTLHLHLMLLGYQVAREWDEGDFPLPLQLFGKMRQLAPQPTLHMAVPTSSTLSLVMHRFFNYFPQTRTMICDVAWNEQERDDSSGRPWLTVRPSYQVRPDWRILVNGRNARYEAGLETAVRPGDTISIFPPGR